LIVHNCNKEWWRKLAIQMKMLSLAKYSIGTDHTVVRKVY